MANPPKPNLFISYKSTVEDFVDKVCHCLDRQANVDYYFNKHRRKAGNFPERLKKAIEKCDTFVFFLTPDFKDSGWQQEELGHWLEARGGRTDRLVVVNMGDELIPVSREKLKELERVMVKGYGTDPRAHISCADEILFQLGINAVPFDDLPTSIEARYEKDIIRLYKSKDSSLTDFVKKGFPPSWPQVVTFRDDPSLLMDNPLDPKRYGQHRSEDSVISVDARYEPRKARRLTFPEAGPRPTVLRPSMVLRVAILVSGGIAPGINAVISAIINRHRTYEVGFRNRQRGFQLHRVEFLGCIEGFKSFSHGGVIANLNTEGIDNWANRGGSLLPTARADQLLGVDPGARARLLDNIVMRLYHRYIDILYIIGGDGSMRAAHAIWTLYEKKYSDRRLSIITIPKTMDNDILWVWQSFGFLSAVEKARQEIIQLATEAESNPRVGIMQLFGSSSGYVVSHAALGSNVCDLALIPELDFNMMYLCEYMGHRLTERKVAGNGAVIRSPYGIIVMAETAIPTDFEDYMNEDYVGLTREEKEQLLLFKANGRRVLGQTPDALRRAGLKIVSRVLQQYIRGVMGRGDEKALGSKTKLRPQGAQDTYWQDFRVFTNEPRHLIRSMEPTVSDVAYGIRLGTMAVDMALAGYTDCMVSQWLTEYVVVPLKLVVLGRKQVPKEGIFWRTVVSKTGQIDYDSLS